MNTDPLELLVRMYRAGVAAANPANCLEPYWPAPATGRTGIIACGKAAVQMTAQATRHYGEDIEGVVIYPNFEQAPDKRLSSLAWYAASHPVPCPVSADAARSALDFASGLAADDLLLVLLSGGGSSLMSLPVDGVTLEEKQDLGRQLLASGASISEINCIRKHVSKVKGGRLAAACKAPVITLAISDIPGDDPSMIASGPTTEGHTTLAQAREILDRYGIRPATSILDALNNPANETPRFAANSPRRDVHIVASGVTALEAAATLCKHEGIEPVILGDGLEGEARVLGQAHAKTALEHATRAHPCCILSGGETTVTIRSPSGVGGRNTEYALALTIGLGGQSGIWAMAADTDGIDGKGNHAGALTDPGTLDRAVARGVDPVAALENNDSATFFKQAGGLFTEGPTGTNVNDFRAILIDT